jgi:hypothetical protein
MKNITHFKVRINCEPETGATVDKLEAWLFSITGTDRNGQQRQLFTLKTIEKIVKKIKKGKVCEWNDGWTRIIITPMEGIRG